MHGMRNTAWRLLRISWVLLGCLCDAANNGFISKRADFMSYLGA